MIGRDRKGEREKRREIEKEKESEREGERKDKGEERERERRENIWKRSKKYQLNILQLQNVLAYLFVLFRNQFFVQ